MKVQNYVDVHVDENITVTIPNGETLSEPITLAGTTLVGVYIPAGWSQATMQFYGTPDPSALSFKQISDGQSGNPISIFTVPGQIMTIPPAALCGLKFVKLSAPAPVVADTTFTLLIRPV